MEQCAPSLGEYLQRRTDTKRVTATERIIGDHSVLIEKRERLIQALEADNVTLTQQIAAERRMHPKQPAIALRLFEKVKNNNVLIKRYSAQVHNLESATTKMEILHATNEFNSQLKLDAKLMKNNGVLSDETLKDADDAIDTLQDMDDMFKEYLDSTDYKSPSHQTMADQTDEDLLAELDSVLGLATEESTVTSTSQQQQTMETAAHNGGGFDTIRVREMEASNSNGTLPMTVPDQTYALSASTRRETEAFQF